MQPITMVGSCLTCGDRGKGYLHASNIVPKQKQSLSTQTPTITMKKHLLLLSLLATALTLGMTS